METVNMEDFEVVHSTKTERNCFVVTSIIQSTLKLWCIETPFQFAKHYVASSRDVDSLEP